MTKQATLHQLSILYQPEQDRMLLRIKLTDLSEFRFWLTRRFVQLFSPKLVGILHAGLPGSEQQAAAIASFQHEQVMSNANFNDPFDAQVSTCPLGEEPVLLGQFQILPLTSELYRLTLLPSAGEGINLDVDKRITSLLCKLLEDALNTSGWDLAFHIAAPQFDAPTDAAKNHTLN
ncbi:MAG: hypothetical protein R8K50_08495 [Mariprofundus sp.]